MSEFSPVRTKSNLALLDDEDIVRGYLDALDGAPEPGSDKSRSYWHGWRNGRTDRGITPIDGAQQQLAREIVGRYRGLN